MKLQGILEATLNGPTGPQALIRCDTPGHEGRYIVEFFQPGDRFEFDVNPQGDGKIGEKLKIAPALAMPPEPPQGRKQ